MHTRSRRFAAAWLTLAFAALPVVAEEGVMPLPAKDLFRPLLADPKEPRFQVGVQWVESDLNDTRVGAVGFGENFGIARWQGRHPQEAWQLNLSTAVFAQFDLDAPSDDLLNADYLVGFPVSYGTETGRYACASTTRARISAMSSCCACTPIA